jgi:hypothetical protein
LHLAGYLSISPGLHLSKERSPGAHRRQADDRPQGGKREAGGRPWGSFVCLFVLHRQRLPRVVQLKPLPFRRTRAGMWPAIPCDESSGLAWGWSRSKAVIPFLWGTGKPQDPTIPKNMVSIPQLLSTSNPRQLVSSGQTSGESGRCQSLLVSWHMPLTC